MPVARGRGKAVAAATVCCAGVAAYEAYRRGWFEKTTQAFRNVVETTQDTAEALGTLAKDVREFLSSDSEVVPQSIRQAIKLASCEETQEAVQANVKATLKSVLAQTRAQGEDGAPDSSESGESEASTSGRTAHNNKSSGESDSDGPEVVRGLRKMSSSTNNMVGQTLEKVFNQGGGFFSVVAASVARQTIETLMENASDQTSSGEAFEKYKDILLSEEGKEFISDLLITLVVESTSIYIDKTIHINTYDQIMETVIKPQHKSFVENLCVKLCKVWTETVMAPSDPQQAAGGGHHALRNTAGDALCSPREYPALLADPPLANCSSNCNSPTSVVSGVKASLSSTPELPRPSQSSNSELVKDILSSAAGDEQVRNFLVSVVSSSSAAATGVVLDAFLPSWLRGSSAGARVAKGDLGVDRTPVEEKMRSEVSQRALSLTFAVLFFFLAMWTYKCR